ncbi:dipeptidyl aminopeptidase/acylaminoacyl-peptidase domain protein [Burkholderia cepacia]|uniref:Dipeptidyl aminopeptidase/acylaminoacyl-peptidase domain protein n=1 Tax=Burkholderia cepacia TaxID=292 RepID=A0AA88Z5Y5_BURCE|nr:dipeptidyl aminopeptidase/acylaminoacyl-peptidase domain protein [Burkholderia cepacia]
MIVEPPFGKNGHGTFTVNEAIPIWLPHFEQFVGPLISAK